MVCLLAVIAVIWEIYSYECVRNGDYRIRKGDELHELADEFSQDLRDKYFV